VTRPGAGGRPSRRSKGQRRIEHILSRIPAAREQLIAAMERFGDRFELERLSAATVSDDAANRNDVAALERDYEVLVNWLDELAARGLSEALRLKAIEKTTGDAFERLGQAGAISKRSAARLVGLRRIRDDLQHAYPWERADLLHGAVNALVHEIDRFIDRYERWLREVGVRDATRD
jgi:uncharacterized protein YutE (UPF0331/DUF86 family)